MSQTLVSIDYVRVKKIDVNDFVRGNKIHDSEFVRANKIGEIDGNDRIYLYGTMIVTDCLGDHIVYHQPDSFTERLSEYISLTGPSPRICGGDKFTISVDLWVKFWVDDGTQITKELTLGDIVWDPLNTQDDRYKKPLEEDVLGKHGCVTVGYSVIREALTATIDVMVMNESRVYIYGTVKANRFLRGGSSTHRLIDISVASPERKSPRKSRSLFSPRRLLAIPVPPYSDLTIEVDLWEYHGSAGDVQIVLGSVQFTPTVGNQKKNITGRKYGVEVHVSITGE